MKKIHLILLASSLLLASCGKEENIYKELKDYWNITIDESSSIVFQSRTKRNIHKKMVEYIADNSVDYYIIDIPKEKLEIDFNDEFSLDFHTAVTGLTDRALSTRDTIFKGDVPDLKIAYGYQNRYQWFYSHRERKELDGVYSYSNDITNISKRDSLFAYYVDGLNYLYILSCLNQ